MRPSIIIADDSQKNLKVAFRASQNFFVEHGFDVYLTDNAQEVTDLIREDEKKRIVGVVTDLLFPREQHFPAYEHYLITLEECAERVWHRVELELKNVPARNYLSRLRSQFDRLRYKNNLLPYGGEIALACIYSYIPFVIVTDTHRHMLEGSQSLDTATLLTPFCDLGFLKLENLTEESFSRHAIWSADKNYSGMWEKSFQQIIFQFGMDIIDGVSTWKKYCDPEMIRQPELSPKMLRGENPGKAFSKISAPWDGDRAIDAVSQKKAKEIIRGNEHGLGSVYSEEEQISFLSKVLVKMGKLDDEISNIKARGFLWIAGEGKIRLPPHVWWQIVYRPDIGRVIAVSQEAIDRGRYNSHAVDNQIRCNILVWKIGSPDKYSNVYSITYWDFKDDLEPPEIKDVATDTIIIEQFGWKKDEDGEDAYDRKMISIKI